MRRTEDISLSDEVILKQFRKNRREGFRLIYEKYADRLFTVCRRYSVDDQEAKDSLHESMLKVFDRLKTFNFEGEGSLYKWITRLTINLILDKKKSIRRQAKALSLYNEVDFTEPDADQIEVLSIEEVEKLVEKLSPIRKVVFYLYFFEGYSHKEIAELLGITENGSSSTLSKAKKDMAELLCFHIREE